MSDIIVYAAGERCIGIAEEVRRILNGEVPFTLVNARFVKPLDSAFLLSRPEKYAVTLEDNVLAGGLGDAVARILRGTGKEVVSFGYGDTFIPHGEVSSLIARYGLDAAEIAAKLRELHARG